MSEYTIDAKAPLTDQIEVVEGGVLVPLELDESGNQLGIGGVFRADGGFVENSLCFIEPHRRVNRAPRHWNKDHIEHRKGVWLFGGKHDLKFGHFLVETISRLWALENTDIHFEGVVFLPERAPAFFRPSRRLKRSAPMLNLFAPLPKCEILTHSVQFEKLVVPPQACGAGRLAQGSPEFRKFVRGRLAGGPRPSGHKKLYISRSHLQRAPGQILFEREIENALSDEGYVIFHPQEHDLQTQVAAYRAADYIIGSEGSAFHLVAYTADSTAKIAMIRRRIDTSSDGIVNQLQSCINGKISAIDTLKESFTVDGSRRVSNAVIDLVRLASQLHEAGFVNKGFALPDKTDQEIEVGKAALAQRILYG